MEQINLPNLSHGLDMRHYDAGTQDDIPNAVIRSSELHPYTLTVSGKHRVLISTPLFSPPALEMALWASPGQDKHSSHLSDLAPLLKEFLLTYLKQLKLNAPSPKSH